MAPSTYYALKARTPSARALRDAVMGPVLHELWEDDYRVYGVRKLGRPHGGPVTPLAAIRSGG